MLKQIQITDNAISALTPKAPEQSKLRKKQSKAVKKYSLSLPEDLFLEIEKISEEHDTTMLDVMKRFIKLGMIAHRVSNDPESALIIREGNREREIVFI